MDTDYKGWGVADSRRAFETNRVFSVERLRVKATQKWRGGLFRDGAKNADERSDDGEASRAPTRVRGEGKTKALLDFGLGLELVPGGVSSESRGWRSRARHAVRPECRLKARLSSNDAAPRVTVRFIPRPELVVGAVVPLEGPLGVLCALGRGREARRLARTETKALPGSPPRDENAKKTDPDPRGKSPRGVCVRVEATAPLSFLGDDRGISGPRRFSRGVSVTARLVRPEARGAFVSTNGLEFDFPDFPLSFSASRASEGEPGDALALRLRGSVDFPRAGFGASADGLGRVDGEDAPVRVAVRKLGVKRVVRWWRQPETRDD